MGVSLHVLHQPSTARADLGRRRAFLGVAVTVAMSLTAGCSTQSRQRWLSVFFDGVGSEKPAPGSGALLPGPGQPAQTNAVAKRAATPPVPRYVHPPFAEYQCDACHESGMSNRIRGPLTEVCFLCHDNFLENAKFKHYPAEAGECTVCHSPHQSDQKYWLLRHGQALCLECHDRADIVKVTAHAQIGETACQTCHNPHAGDVRFFLKPHPQTEAAPKPAGPAQ